MNPVALVRSDTNEPAGYFCGKCGTIYGRPSGDFLESATRCCSCSTCGAEIGRSWCKDCRAKHEAEQEAVDYEKAKKVPLAEYAERFLFLDGRYVDLDNEDAFEGYEWAFGCSPIKPSMDLAREISESVLSDHHEEAEEWVDDEKIAAAQKLIDEALADVVSYEEDRSVVVILHAQPKEKETASS